MADATDLELVVLQRGADQDLNIGGSVPRRDRRSDGESIGARCGIRKCWLELEMERLGETRQT